MNYFDRFIDEEISRKKYNCIKQICAELKKNFKGMQTNSYGYCCNSDYDARHKYINQDDYVCAKLFKGGLNNSYGDGYFSIGKDVYFNWNCTKFALIDIIRVMQNVAIQYNASVLIPENNGKCIGLVFMDGGEPQNV